jgi:pantothenate kinase-related protein Tda10
MVNEFLRDYAGLHFLFDAWVVLKVESPIVVYDWRLEAERNMRKAGKPSLSDAQVQDFIDRFMPAYRAYLPALYASGPERRENTTALMVNRHWAVSCSMLTLSLWCEQVAMDRSRRATSFEEVPPLLTSRLASI